MAQESRKAERSEWTAREREVLELIVRGRTNGEIAETLGISFATAKWHVSELISKLAVGSREDVAEYWRRERSIRRRLGRLARALVAAPGLKIAAGGVLLSATVAGAGVLWVGLSATSDSGELSLPDTSATATSAPLRDPVQPTPVKIPAVSQPLQPQGGRPAGCPTSASSPNRADLFELMLCPALNYPEIAALDRGKCDLSGAELKAANNFAQIDFRGCRLDAAVLDEQVFASSSFEGVSARALSAHGAMMSMSVFRGADLSGADLSQAQLQAADFSGANLDGADLTDSIVRGATWKDTVCPDGTNSTAHRDTCVGTLSVSDYWPASTAAPHETWPAEGAGGWAKAVCWPKSGYTAPYLCPYTAFPQFAGTPGASCTAPGGVFVGADLRYADLRGCDLSRADLSGADLGYAVLAGANLSGANMTGAKLLWTDATNANLRGTNLAGGVVSHSSLEGADLRGASLANALFRPAYGNTICPDGTNSDADDGDSLTCDRNR
jgi:uncharacterized protein YjbI with pentapeptide repeats/DNA-binding CsgD family transcriptional regulator